jgi:hypothetical protein
VVLRVVSLLEVKRLTLRPSSPFWRSNARSLRIPSRTLIVVPLPVRLLLPMVPLADAALQLHRLALLRNDLPGCFALQVPQGDAFQVAAAIGALASEQRDARAETLARVTADNNKTPTGRWGPDITKLLRIAQVATAAELAPIWAELAKTPKRLERPTMQAWADTTASKLGMASSAPIITPALTGQDYHLPI